VSQTAAANLAIADMAGPGALPRKSGELVFHAEWERRAFAMAVDLAQQQVFQWSEFQAALIAAIAEAEAGDSTQPTRGYYESWLVALEHVLNARQL
jgi:nitrile hydratase accessory protein